jgi:hypothetical protein
VESFNTSCGHKKASTLGKTSGSKIRRFFFSFCDVDVMSVYEFLAPNIHIIGPGTGKRK